jgi:hypothetical protein
VGMTRFVLVGIYRGIGPKSAHGADLSPPCDFSTRQVSAIEGGAFHDVDDVERFAPQDGARPIRRSAGRSPGWHVPSARRSSLGIGRCFDPRGRGPGASSVPCTLDIPKHRAQRCDASRAPTASSCLVFGYDGVRLHRRARREPGRFAPAASSRRPALPRISRRAGRGGGIIIAKRHKATAGAISTATVPSAYARLSMMATKPLFCGTTRSCAIGGRRT